MANRGSYSIKEKVGSIKSKINTQNTVNDFLNKAPEFNKFNSITLPKEIDNIFKIMSDLVTTLIGGQDNVKNMITEFVTKQLDPLELESKQIMKDAIFEVCSCNVNTKLNVPGGVIDISPSEIPFIEQYDFYGLFLKDINDPAQKLSFDNNLNTFLKETIDNQTTESVWVNKDGVEVVKFNFNYLEDRVFISQTNTGPSSNWGPTGISLPDFVDLYVDEVNLFPSQEILKQLLDVVLNVDTNNPFSVELNETLNFLLKEQGKCNCNVEDDRSKSTFDIGYEDFLPTEDRPDDLTNTDYTFGPVDYPISNENKKKKLNAALLNNSELLTKNEFKNGKNKQKQDSAEQYIDNMTEAAYNNTNDLSIQTPELKLTLDPMMKYDVNLKMLLLVPSLLVMGLFSPKITMLLGIIYKRYNIDNPNKDLWKTKESYYAFAQRFILVILKHVIKSILKMIWDKVKREIIKLLKRILVKILSEKLYGYINQLQSIIQIITALAGSIPPTIPRIKFGNCHSMLDGLEQLFNLPNIPPGIPLPPGMSFFGAFKSGLSPTQMTQQAVDKMGSLGLDTQPMPDGTPNPNVLIANAMSTAIISQFQQNARIQVDTIPFVGTGGATIT